MGEFASLSPRGQLRRVNRLARRALARYGLASDSRITLLNHSENTTYRIDDPALSLPRVMRVHRAGYHTKYGIMSELAWMKALNDEAGVHTPQAVPGLDGALVQYAEGPGLDAPRHVVLFQWVAGRRPDETKLIKPVERLGEISARMHGHILGWTKPEWFERITWDADKMIGKNVNWGHWEDAPGLDAEHLELLNALADALRARLAAFGKDPAHYDYVHADFRIANLRFHKGYPYVLDFEVPDIIASWVKGYRKVRTLSDREIEEIPTFMMLRQMILMGWMASHAETALAAELGPEASAATCRSARTFLDDPTVFLDRERWRNRPHRPEALRSIRG
jgi:Ser/Thr protein kinase RdoA (MazF antagonist)